MFKTPYKGTIQDCIGYFSTATKLYIYIYLFIYIYVYIYMEF